jgi:hypothetical protein
MLSEFYLEFPDSMTVHWGAKWSEARKNSTSFCVHFITGQPRYFAGHATTDNIPPEATFKLKKKGGSS